MADWDGLENRSTRKGTQGSNPCPSASDRFRENPVPCSDPISLERGVLLPSNRARGVSQMSKYSGDTMESETLSPGTVK